MPQERTKSVSHEMTLSEIIRLADGKSGAANAGGTPITGVASLRDAQPGDISFLANKKYAPLLATTKASAVFVGEDSAGAESGAALVVVNSPDAAFAQIVPLFTHSPPVYAPGVHPSAVIGENAIIGEGVHIGPNAVVGEGARIGAFSVIGANVVVGEGVIMGERCHLHPLSSVRERCVLGDRVTLHNGAVVGSDGYGYTPKVNPDGSVSIAKIPQLGIVELGDDVEIGSNTTIDRARFGVTKIGRMTKIDNLVQIAHNVRIGECCGIVANVGIAGSTHIGNGVMIWGQVGIAGHLEIADGVEILARSGVSKSITEKGVYFGAPAVERREGMRLLHIPKRVENLEKEIAGLKTDGKK